MSDEQQQVNASDESCSSYSSSDASTTSWEEHPEETWTEEQQEEDENSPEKERQLLLLMLLAQVCALHDPSPKTFTVHVLELFERGILDRESIRFLFELGLVPSHSTQTSTQLLLSNQDVTTALEAVEAENAMQIENALQLIPPPTRQMSMEQVRTQEASAIRLHLEQSHKDSNETSPRYSSFSVEHHPLSLSRFQREFRQVRLLKAGAFGQVFHVVSKLDGTEYAVKRVAFGVNGYHSEKITQAVREVTCLAQCHHPHCVRYYTSWLEPSWMTGSNVGEQQPLLLTIGSASSSFQSSRRRASFSFGANHLHEYEEWTRPKDDSFLESQPNKTCSPPTSNYRYEICLFIQMQLCTSSTLADWIQTRNANAPPPKSRAGPAIQIFTQLLHGMAHVHEKNIVHRDLKPANIFVSQDGRFLIGDFGLSRLLRHANGGRDFVHDTAHDAEPLTVGIGTASYAAPEQLKSRDYGTAADVFGLGLILLELFCVFETEHERITTFRKCRSQSLPEWLSKEYPYVAEIILKCTKEKPSERPTAADLCSKVLTEQDILRLQLEEKDKLLQKQRSEIDEKDKIIEELKSQVKRMSMERDGIAKVEMKDNNKVCGPEWR
jgi:serine/threonine protein kinase